MNFKANDPYGAGYFISENGDIFNTLRENRKLKPVMGSRGYYIISLRQNGVNKTPIIHRLVAQIYVKGFKKGLTVNHKDGNKTNNHYLNLEWVTQKENDHHARTVLGKHGKGSMNGRAKLKEKDVLKIRERISNGESLGTISKDYAVWPTLIFKIKHRLLWSHI